MSRKGRTVTILIHKEGDLESQSIILRLWLVRAAVVGSIVLAVLILLGAAVYAPIARTAARVPGLNREVARLKQENAQVRELAANLERVEARYAQLRTMLGGDVVPDLIFGGDSLESAPALVARIPNSPPCYEVGPSVPRYWPLGITGILTRGLVTSGNSDEVHTGLDIAVRRGTPIRASGGGVIESAALHPEYGQYIRITHPDGYTSMYGHASRVLVAPGDSVVAGEVIGLSGSTGRSTAPHLHFEILQHGRSIDPKTVASQECSRGDILIRRG